MRARMTQTSYPLAFVALTFELLPFLHGAGAGREVSARDARRLLKYELFDARRIALRNAYYTTRRWTLGPR